MDPYGYDDSDEAAQIAAAMSGIPIRQQAIQARQRRAQALMATPTAQGREVGRTYVASSPLEHAATALARAMGMRDANAAEADLAPLAQQAERAGYAEKKRALAPAPASWGAPAGMTRPEALHVLPTILKPGTKHGPVPDSILEAIGERGGRTGAELDALRDNYDVAMDIYKQKGEHGITPPTPEQIARGKALKVPLLPAENENSKQYEDALRAREVDQSKESDKGGKAMSDRAAELRREILGQQTYKDAQTVAAAYEKIKRTSETGAGDMALIFNYMKLLDPGSTVREGEYATAQNSGSVPQNVAQWWNRALKGEKLPPEVRRNFRDEASRAMSVHAERFATSFAPYRRLAEKYGIDPEDVVLDVGLGQYVLAPNGGAAAPAPEPAGAPPAAPRLGSPKPPGAGASPVRVSSPEEARKLPPGTRFVTPDGREFTR
jgi:hypothetical protein